MLLVANSCCARARCLDGHGFHRRLALRNFPEANQRRGAVTAPSAASTETRDLAAWDSRRREATCTKICKPATAPSAKPRTSKIRQLRPRCLFVPNFACATRILCRIFEGSCVLFGHPAQGQRKMVFEAVQPAPRAGCRYLQRAAHGSAQSIGLLKSLSLELDELRGFVDESSYTCTFGP